MMVCGGDAFRALPNMARVGEREMCCYLCANAVHNAGKCLSESWVLRTAIDALLCASDDRPEGGRE